MIRLNAGAFIKFFLIRRRRLWEGGVYLKSNLLFANNSMVTHHFDFKKKKNMFECLSWMSFFILFSISYMKWIRSYVRYVLSTSELVYSKGFASGSLKISNCDRSNDRCVLFDANIRINAASWCRVSNISTLKCGVYPRAAFNRLNMVFI